MKDTSLKGLFCLAFKKEYDLSGNFIVLKVS